jgi:DNA ligase-1
MNVLLAKKWNPKNDPTGWWMSEKLDGVRAYWNGTAFVSRLGNVFAAPAWYRAAMPRTTLDGELWCGRGAFQDTVSIVRSHADKGWSKVVYRVFDAPDMTAPFEERMNALRVTMPHAAHDDAGPNVSLVSQTECDGVEYLCEMMAFILKQGGEGVMLRQPGSLYHFGRHASLLKVKQFADAEGTVLAHEPGKGKHVGRLGALVMRADNGATFNCGTGFTDAEREAPPPVGARVTYSYQELTRDGVPRFPAFIATRDYE